MNAEKEIENRVEFLKGKLAEAHADGFVFGNSGGKDSALVGILCKKTGAAAVGIIMPCDSQRNYGMDKTDAEELAARYDIKTEYIDITPMKDVFRAEYGRHYTLSENASININPRLRMITLYAYAQSHNLLVAGTGNACEAFVGYFTKWGDGAYDVNPIGDMKVSEIYELLRHLDAPANIISKAPSAALAEGQTDEGEMGITYAEIEAYMNGGADAVSPSAAEKIESMHRKTEHKRNLPAVYKK